MKLDGELWAGRCRFAAVGSLMGSSSLEGGRWYETAWRSLTFVVFDAPHAGGTYLQRLEKARARIAAMGPPDGCVAMLARRFICPFHRRPHRRRRTCRRIVVAPVMEVADAAAKRTRCCSAWLPAAARGSCCGAMRLGGVRGPAKASTDRLTPRSPPAPLLISYSLSPR